ncbi:glycosyltransferase family 39 protein [candidate division KSB1 bacterium]|nr:glycosyltransferase family 39 protein [candidate division KSB1 bacterium]
MEKSKIIVIIAFGCTIIHFIFLMSFFKPAISTPDAQGYFTQAKLIATTGKSSLTPASPIQYLGPHWFSANQNDYYATFPPGFPVLLSIPYKFLGPQSALYVNPILASITLFGLFLIVRLLLGDWWGLIALLLFAFNPVTNEHALFGDSHTSVIFFLILGLLFLSIWYKKRASWTIFLAGLCWGIIPTIRYAESILLLAFFTFLLLNFKRERNFYISFTVACFGAALPLVALAVRNHIAFGAFWKTAYGIPEESAHFGLNCFVQHFMPFVGQLLSIGIGILFITGLIGSVLLLRDKNRRSMGIFFVLLIIPLTFIYMAYVWPPDPQSMRFLLPTFPIYIILSVWFLKILSEKNLKTGIAVTILILILTVLAGLPRTFHSLKQLKLKNEVLANITEELAENIQAENILIANEGILQNLDFQEKWKLANIDLLLPHPDVNPRVNRDRKPPQKRIRNLKAQERYAALSKEELFINVIDDLQRWSDPDKRIYLLFKEDQISWLQEQITEKDSLKIIKKINIPDLSHLKAPVPKSRNHPQPIFDGNRQSNIRIMRPNQIYDFFIDGKLLLLVEWKWN